MWEVQSTCSALFSIRRHLLSRFHMQFILYMITNKFIFFCSFYKLWKSEANFKVLHSTNWMKPQIKSSFDLNNKQHDMFFYLLRNRIYIFFVPYTICYSKIFFYFLNAMCLSEFYPANKPYAQIMPFCCLILLKLRTKCNWLVTSFIAVPFFKFCHLFMWCQQSSCLCVEQQKTKREKC